MRKLVLSLAVVALSGAYVVQAAMARDGGLEALIDRLLFRGGDQPLPLDLDGPLADELFTSISATVDPSSPAPFVH